MKKIALLLIFTLMLGATLALTSCNNNSSYEEPAVCYHDWDEATTTSPKTCSICGETEGEPLSAYEVLNDDEKEVYSALKNFASTLNAPSSLKLIDLKVGKTSADDTTESVFVKVSANNAFGSPVTEVYVMEYGRLDIGGSSWYSVAGAWHHYGSVSKINAALQKYFNDMGW